jgi:hypothetical protein
MIKCLNKIKCLIEEKIKEESKFTSIHRSQIEQCEHRGGRNILHVRQYFI